jgi:hypothetical protein
VLKVEMPIFFKKVEMPYFEMLFQAFIHLAEKITSRLLRSPPFTYGIKKPFKFQANFLPTFLVKLKDNQFAHFLLLPNSVRPSRFGNSTKASYVKGIL